MEKTREIKLNVEYDKDFVRKFYSRQRFSTESAKK